MRTQTGMGYETHSTIGMRTQSRNENKNKEQDRTENP